MKIRSDVLRLYQSLHTWVGICAGLFLFIGFFAGAMTMFKQPLDRWSSAPTHTLRPLPVVKLDQLLKDVLSQQAAARKEFTLHLAPRENIAAPVTWNVSMEGREIDLSAKRWLASLDEHDRLQMREELPSLLTQLIDMLHRTGGIPGTLGDEYLGIYVMGIAGVLYFLALSSGLILLLPTLVKDFFALRLGKNRKRFWLDAHNIIGITSLPFHLLISVTVIVFAFHDVFYGSLSRVVYGDQSMFGKPPALAASVHDVSLVLPVSQLIQTIAHEAPDFEIQELLYMGLESERPILRAALYNPRYLVQGPQTAYLMLDPYTGKVVNDSMLPGKGNIWSALVTPLFSLHFGSYGGDLIRGVYFVFGISGAFLFYSGNLLWLEKRRKNLSRDQAVPEQSLSTKLMAAASVGVCLGAVAGVGLSLVAGKWLYAVVGNINKAYLLVYYSVFVLSIVWAFYRGAGRASVELLRLCAGIALMIPLTSLLVMLIPALGLWVNGRDATLSVDLFALFASGLFVYAARLTQTRVQNGARDSVWSA